MLQDVLDIAEDIQAMPFGRLGHAKQYCGRASAFVAAKKQPRTYFLGQKLSFIVNTLPTRGERG